MSNNFGSFPAHRNPTCMVRINGGVAEAMEAGGSQRKKLHNSSPWKKPLGEETFLLRLDQAKATAEQGRTESIELVGDPEDWTKDGRPRKVPPKTTKPPPITQEDNRFGDLASEEEEFHEDDVDDEELDANGIAANDEVTCQSIPARPREAKRDGGADDRTDGGRPKNCFPRTVDDLDKDDDKELDAARDEAMRESISAHTCGA